MPSPNRSTQSEADEWLTPAEAAALRRVSVRTLSRAADRGEVVSVRTPGGRRRYLRSSVLALFEEANAS